MYVCPGVGYQLTFSLTQKRDVNAQNKDAVFAYLKDKLRCPYDDPFSLTTGPKLIMWCHSGVAWNFEVSYGASTFQTININPHMKSLL
jgi:glutathione peroxidase-family protein